MKTLAIRINLLPSSRPPLQLVASKRCAPAGWNLRGANEVGDFMEKDTSDAESSNKGANDPLLSSNQNYTRQESERARQDLHNLALQHAKRRGANIEPPSNCKAPIYLSDFWFFIDQATRGCRFVRFSAQSLDQSRKRLTELKKSIVPLLELLGSEQHKQALLSLNFENGLIELPSVEQHTKGALLAECGRECLDQLRDEIDMKLERLRAPKSAPRGNRGRLIRWALGEPVGGGGWWPTTPTDDDLAALSILTGVASKEFESDFNKRQQLASVAGRGSPSTTHLQGLWDSERRRCKT